MQEKCDYILVAGDIFDKPNPDQKVKDQLVSQILNYIESSDQLSFIFLAGNHDFVTKAKKYNSIEYLDIFNDALRHDAYDSKDRVHVIKAGQFLKLPDLDVYALPRWEPVPSMIVNRLNRTTKPLVLTWHGVVPGLSFSNISHIPNSVADDVKQLLKQSGAKYIALGDIHRRMKVGKRCWYSGPPVQKAYPDIDGFLIVKLQRDKVKIHKHRLDLPRKYTLDLHFEEGETTEEDLIEFVKTKVPEGNLLKLKFELPLSIWSSLNQKHIKDALKDSYLELKLDNDRMPESRSRRATKKVAQAKTIFEELDAVIEEEDFGLNTKKLRNICKKYL